MLHDITLKTQLILTYTCHVFCKLFSSINTQYYVTEQNETNIQNINRSVTLPDKVNFKTYLRIIMDHTIKK